MRRATTNLVVAHLLVGCLWSTTAMSSPQEVSEPSQEEAVSAVPFVTAEQFDATVRRAKGPVLVETWGYWCGPCRMVRPISDRLAKRWATRITFYRLDVDAAEEVRLREEFRGIPAFVVYSSGRQVAVRVGAVNTQELEEFLSLALARIETKECAPLVIYPEPPPPKPERKIIPPAPLALHEFIVPMLSAAVAAFFAGLSGRLRARRLSPPPTTAAATTHSTAVFVSRWFALCSFLAGCSAWCAWAAIPRDADPFSILSVPATIAAAGFGSAYAATTNLATVRWSGLIRIAIHLLWLTVVFAIAFSMAWPYATVKDYISSSLLR